MGGKEVRKGGDVKSGLPVGGVLRWDYENDPDTCAGCGFGPAAAGGDADV